MATGLPLCFPYLSLHYHVLVGHHDEPFIVVTPSGFICEEQWQFSEWMVQRINSLDQDCRFRIRLRLRQRFPTWQLEQFQVMIISRKPNGLGGPLFHLTHAIPCMKSCTTADVTWNHIDNGTKHLWARILSIRTYSSSSLGLKRLSTCYPFVQ